MAGPAAKEGELFPRGTPLAGSLALILCFLTWGCTLGGPELLEPPASAPTLGTPVANRRGVSTLVVATPPTLDYNVGHPEDGPLHRPTGYTLYDERGQKLQYVRNYIGALDVEPTIIELAPGRYLILLDKPEQNPRLFWVRLEAGKITEVRCSR